MDEQSVAAASLATEKAIADAVRPKENSLPAVADGEKHAPDAPEQNEIFSKLVSGDEDIVGLVAYSIYKQNKIDWLRAFEERNGRAPDDQEFAAYIIGENTPRRVSTYRFLADSTVSKSTGRTRDGEAARSTLGATMNIIYGFLGVAVVAALIILARFVFTLRHG